MRPPSCGTDVAFSGMYCPYIANAMLDAEDKTYFDVKGMTIYDPLIGPEHVIDAVAVPFIDHHSNLFPFNDSYVKHIHELDHECGFDDFRDKHLTYPPKGHAPATLPGIDHKTGKPKPGCEDQAIFNSIWDAALAINPCWDVYQVATTCPLLWDVMGFPGSMEYVPKGASIYFDRADVKAAINAPVHKEWLQCGGPVFKGDTDLSPPSADKVLGSVIDRTKNVIIGHGDLDFVLLANQTLLSIQNMTFGGKLGFQEKPTEPFYVPYHNDKSKSTLAGAGVFGTTHTERGLTYVGVALSGHMIPQYAPSAAFRHVEFMLGRVKSLSSKEPFTIDAKYPQPRGPLGQGIILPNVHSVEKPHHGHW